MGTGATEAVNAVNRAVRRGIIPPANTCRCVDCDKPAEQYEHRDYNKPLDVEPICRSCNHRRGPAVPRKGYFSDFFRTGYMDYTSRPKLAQFLRLAGIEADLTGVPYRIKYKHWLPFKAQLLEWESTR